MKDAVARCQPLGDEFKLSKKQTPKSKASKRRMAKIKHYLYQKKLHEPLGEAKPLGMKVEDRIRCGKKPSASNKMFLIRQLVNTKIKEGASVVDHGNEFKSILSRLVLVVIKFDDEVHAMFLLSSLLESSWALLEHLRAWYKRCAMDHCRYLKKVNSSSIILLLYVDNMLVAGSYMVRINKLKRQSSQELEMKDLGSSRHEHH
ncbi:retrovirus-related pol polyprotein from transposon TNT 1-94 [Tanacetum coccineum]